jgi:sentrin-specific protease 1
LDIREVSLVQELFESTQFDHVEIFMTDTLKERTKPCVIKNPLTFITFRRLRELSTQAAQDPSLYLISDCIIDIYMDILQTRSIAFARRKLRPLSLFLPCFVAGETSSVTPEKLKQKDYWEDFLMRSGLNDWAEVDKVYFPAYHNPLHWVLYVFSLRSHCCVVYDSLKGHDGNKFEVCREYVNSMIEGNLDPIDWQLIFNNIDQPVQLNGVDCGVFTVMTADFLTDDLKLDFSQADINHFRLKIACDIIRGYLTYDS